MRRLHLLVVLAALPAIACSDGDAAACDAPTREALDPAFVQHVVPGTEPEYVSDPPTSGPHQPGPDVSGALDEPLARPVQVGLLEAGSVLVQYRDAHLQAAAGALAGDVDGAIVVAPNPDLDQPVVVTAWTWKMRCDTVDAAAIRGFATEHRDDGPGAD